MKKRKISKPKVFRTPLELVLWKKRMTQKELAEKTGMTRAAVSQLVSGKKDVVASLVKRKHYKTTLQRICEVLNVNASDLINY